MTGQLKKKKTFGGFYNKICRTYIIITLVLAAGVYILSGNIEMRCAITLIITASVFFDLEILVFCHFFFLNGVKFRS